MRSLALVLVLLATALLPRPASAIVVLGWHDIQDRIPDGYVDAEATSTRNLAMQLDWLRAHGYVPVRPQALRDARAGRATLPAKAVLLTFDGGYRSAYTRALPLLQAFGYPALVALPTARIDLPAGASVRDGMREQPRDTFLTWRDVKALQASGLVEFASQGHELMAPTPADPQRDPLPAGLGRRWDGAYESADAYRERLRGDLDASIGLIQRATGQRPQALLLPAPLGNSAVAGLAESMGLPVVLASDARTGTADARLAGRMQLDDDPARALRLVMHENPGASDLAYELRRDLRLDGLRGIHVRLDDIAADGATSERAVDALVERIRAIHPSHVFLQALTDGNGDGAPDAAYFPTTRMPLRADLFTHVAAVLRSRAGVEVFAWLPAGVGDTLGVYEDLALAAPIAGIVLDHGDASAAPMPTPAAAQRWRPSLMTVHAFDTRAGALPAAFASYASAGDFIALKLPRGLRAHHGDIDRLVTDVAHVPGAIERTLFIIDAGDASHAVPARELEAQVRRVLAAGGRHVAYSQDNARSDQPPLEPARAAISARAFPYLEP